MSLSTEISSRNRLCSRCSFQRCNSCPVIRVSRMFSLQQRKHQSVLLSHHLRVSRKGRLRCRILHCASITSSLHRIYSICTRVKTETLIRRDYGILRLEVSSNFGKRKVCDKKLTFPFMLTRINSQTFLRLSYSSNRR